MKKQHELVPHRRPAGVAALLGLICLSLVPSSAQAGTLCTNQSPDGQIAVANNNVEERDPADMANHGDMRNFIDRLLNGAGNASGHQIPYTPDVVLLQEVRASSADYIGGLLTAGTGCRFNLAVSPGENYVVKNGDPVYFRETAILLNTDTMEKVGNSGYFVTKYTASEGKPGVKRAFKGNAWGMARDLQSGETISLASVHLAKDGSLRSLRVARKVKNRWARQLASFLKRKFPNADLSSIGGDFNANRCNFGDENCSGAPFWRTLINDFNYRDSYWEIKDFGRYIDYIFAKRFVVDADEDNEYDQHSDPYYSDHQFRWATLASKDVVPPKPFTIWEANGWGKPMTQIKWTQSFDGGGLGAYKVLEGHVNGGQCEDFRVISTRERIFENKNIDKFATRCYQVKVSDAAGNTTFARLANPLVTSTSSALDILDEQTIAISAGVH
ncbi:MAG: endonuclease/exonuclease/phosphatase family protein [Actinomycetota bacterium]|nr:endonuclease/exonuclease/phosphatase family protein [Actinomycetota bacterium]